MLRANERLSTCMIALFLHGIMSFAAMDARRDFSILHLFWFLNILFINAIKGTSIIRKQLWVLGWSRWIIVVSHGYYTLCNGLITRVIEVLEVGIVDPIILMPPWQRQLAISGSRKLRLQLTESEVHFILCNAFAKIILNSILWEEREKLRNGSKITFDIHHFLLTVS